jgi:putative endopeptidase
VGWGSYMTLRKKSLEQSRAIVEDAAKNAGDDAAKQKIGAYYSAFLNQAKIETLGLTPVNQYLQTIDKLTDHDQVAEFLGAVNPAGIDGPFNLYVGQDDKEASSYILHFVESGLGLPDRDYYSDDSERGREIIVRYQQYLEELLALSGHSEAKLPHSVSWLWRPGWQPTSGTRLTTVTPTSAITNSRESNLKSWCQHLM